MNHIIIELNAGTKLVFTENEHWAATIELAGKTLAKTTWFNGPKPETK